MDKCAKCKKDVAVLLGTIEGMMCSECAEKLKSYRLPKTTQTEKEPEGMNNVSDGSTADYYKLPPGAYELQHLISYRNMNSQMGEIFRACYRYGIASHSDRLRDAKKIKFYIDAEIARLEKYGDGS